MSVIGPNLFQKNDATTSEATKLTTKCVVHFDHPLTISIEVTFFFGFLIDIAQKYSKLCILASRWLKYEKLDIKIISENKMSKHVFKF